jgi:hypothetical protein
MTTDITARQPKGIPVGGQFAATAHSEPAVALAQKVTPFHDADGTDWEFGGDEYTDIYNSLENGIEARVTTDIREGGSRATVVDYRGRYPLVIGEQTHLGSLDDAKAHAKEIRERARGYEHNHVSAGFKSPWGEIQETTVLAPGIDAVYTAGHGGLKITPERDQDIDPAWRERAGWYEEDCAWSKAAITHHRDLSADYVAAAHQTARKWYPDEYDAIVGKDPAKYGVTDFTPVTAKESHVVADRQFLAARAGTHDKVQEIRRDLDAHPGMVAVTLSDIPADGREPDNGQANNVRAILVPEAEWKLPYTEKFTFPKTDKYETLPLAGV